MGRNKKDHKFYYIYKITNLINGKFYIGQRSTNILPEKDKYFGSGTMLKLAIKKYGKENFSKEIIELCCNVLELNKREKFYIKEFSALDRSIAYNIAPGGEGGVSMFGKDNPMYGKIGELNPFYGKHHPKELIQEFSKRGLNRDKVICPYCKKIMNYVNAYQYHFDNCPENPKNNKNLILKQRRLKNQLATKSSIKKKKCPYCGKLASSVNSKKYHFENCIYAPILSEYTKNRLKEVKINRRIKEIELIKKRKEQKDKKENTFYECEYCGFKTNSLINFKKWHGENCKNNVDSQRKVYKCKYCGLETTNKTNIVRFHNENCKLNPNKI